MIAQGRPGGLDVTAGMRESVGSSSLRPSLRATIARDQLERARRNLAAWHRFPAFRGPRPERLRAAIWERIRFWRSELDQWTKTERALAAAGLDWLGNEIQ